MNKFNKLLISILISLQVLLVASNYRVFAVPYEDPSDLDGGDGAYGTASAGLGVGVTDECDADKMMYERSQYLWDQNIIRTTDNFWTSMLISYFTNLTGTNLTRASKCESFLEARLISALGGGMCAAKTTPCSGTLPAECAALTNDVAFLMDDSNKQATNTIGVRSIQSSLLGFSNKVEGFAKHEPLPVNLAFFWNESISKVPFVNKALAADPPTYSNLPIIKASFGAWRFVRNVSLGLVSIVLLYTGLMIIMRKRVNPQLVVSVQYAIPKIIIGLLLIIFSYPIGATIAAISWGVFRGAFDIIYYALAGITGGSLGDNASGLLTMSLVMATFRLGQGGLTGFFYGVITVIVILVVLVLKIVVYFKAILIYIKMVLSIVTAPLEFTLGTVPGSEARITDWFVRMAKYAITIFAMGIIIPLTLFMAVSVVGAYRCGLGAEMGGWGTIMTVVAPLIIVIFGFSMAIGIENTIDTLLFGDVKKKRH